MCEMVSIIAKPLVTRVVAAKYRFSKVSHHLPARFGRLLRRYGARRVVKAFTHALHRGSLPFNKLPCTYSEVSNNFRLVKEKTDARSSRRAPFIADVTYY